MWGGGGGLKRPPSALVLDGAGQIFGGMWPIFHVADFLVGCEKGTVYSIDPKLSVFGYGEVLSFVAKVVRVIPNSLEYSPKLSAGKFDSLCLIQSIGCFSQLLYLSNNMHYVSRRPIVSFPAHHFFCHRRNYSNHLPPYLSSPSQLNHINHHSRPTNPPCC